MAKKLNWNGTEVGARAAAVTYNNQQSGMNAGNVQDAIDELKTAIGSGGSSGGGGSYAPYAGKRMGIFGDSFTAGAKKWNYYMLQYLPGLVTNNKAVSGARWSSSATLDGNSQSIIQQLREYYADCVANNYWPDYLLMVCGLNDYNDDISGGGDYTADYIKPVIFSEIDDVTNDTSEENFITYLKSVFYDGTPNDHSSFSAGMQMALTYAAVRFPNAKIVVGFTPNGQTAVLKYGSDSGWTPFSQYIDRMKTIATMYGAKFIDTTNTDIAIWVKSRRLIYYSPNQHTGEPGVDGHPSNLAHQRIGEHMAKILMSELW